MARHVADVRLALSVMSGSDARDPWYVPVPLVGPAVAKPIKVAVAIDPGGEGIHLDVADGVRKAARALERAGYAVEEVDPPAVRCGHPLPPSWAKTQTPSWISFFPASRRAALTNTSRDSPSLTDWRASTRSFSSATR